MKNIKRLFSLFLTIVVTACMAGGIRAAGATQNVVTEGKDFIMGCEDPGFSKSVGWSESSLSIPGGQKSYFCDKEQTVIDIKNMTTTATWKPNLAQHDNITISYYNAAAADQEKADPIVRFEIVTRGKTTIVSVDTTEGNDGWVELGTFPFAGDDSESVTLRRMTPMKGTSTITRATALRFSVKSGREMLERLGMLEGETDAASPDYLSDNAPTRVRAAEMIFRLQGLQSEAASYTGTNNFADGEGTEWSNILAYIKAHPEFGMVGVGYNQFAPESVITAKQYAKILLEALEYRYAVDYKWEEVLDKAKEIGIQIDEEKPFTVKAMIDATVSALKLPLHWNKGNLLEKMIARREGIRDDEYLLNPVELSGTLKSAQTEMRRKERKLIYNNDGCDTTAKKDDDNYSGDIDLDAVTESITHENFLSKRTTGLEKTRVSTIMYCDGIFNSYTHRSSGETNVRKVDWSYALADVETKMDPLETQIDFGRNNKNLYGNNIEVFWSMRMNDCHDAKYEENQLDPWKQEHKDWLFGRRETRARTLPYGSINDTRNWSAVNYGIPEVRQKVYNILKDTVTRYDVDGIQLDFTRYPIFFKQVAMTGEVHPESVERMNNLIRSVRYMMNKVSAERGKPLLLAIYVPDSIDFCKALGLDIKTWMQDGLIDMAAVRTTMAIQSWKDSVTEYSPYDVQLHATFDFLLGMPATSSTGLNYYSEAAYAINAGVDGIQTYNFFNAQNKDLLTNLASPRLDASYTGTGGTWYDSTYQSRYYRTPVYGMNVKNSERFIKEIPYSANYPRS